MLKLSLIVAVEDLSCMLDIKNAAEKCIINAITFNIEETMVKYIYSLKECTAAVSVSTFLTLKGQFLKIHIGCDTTRSPSS